MLILNLVRALLLLAAIGLYHIYNMEFLTWTQGLVIFSISFFGLTLWEIIEAYMVSAFKRTPRETSALPARWLAGPAPRNGE